MQHLKASLLLAGIIISSLSYGQIALEKQVEIRRTEYGVPHILADNLKAVAFGLAFAECEDRGELVIDPLIWARGEISLYEGQEYVPSDFSKKLSYALASETYHNLSQDTRDMMEGFAAGVNFYIAQNPDLQSKYPKLMFTGVDVAASNNFGIPNIRSAREFTEYLEKKRALENQAEVGSNAWAFSPSRTKSGKAILMRNPHLSWTAGYYEAHLTVPSVLNFYGDFRIGGLFAIIGGFNPRLGWSTTNNNPDLEEVYALKVDPNTSDHYLLDGQSFPIDRKTVEVTFKNGDGAGIEKQEYLHTKFGPVITRGDGYIYVLKAGGYLDYRRGEQFLKMMKAQNLEEWKDAMRMQAITTSNYTYADADGNILLVWNAATPNLPHPYNGDSLASYPTSSDQIWQDIVPFDELPITENPAGGYVQNCNDPFYYYNLVEPLPLTGWPENFPEPRFRLRSQHSVDLIQNEKKLKLKDIIELKHSMKMLAADRLKPDLIKGLQSADKFTEEISILEKWDNTASAESSGSVLFKEWFYNYRSMVGSQEMYREKWTQEKPRTTPLGIAYPDSALVAFTNAAKTVKEKYGSLDVKWGDIHRVRRGEVDVPVGGCPGAMGCFRVLNFRESEDGKMVARSGDGWVFTVEFTDPVKAYSVLAYGQSNREESAHHADQVELFAENKMKKVAFTEKEISKSLVEKYRPGEKRKGN